jgi:hypothetical protein
MVFHPCAAADLPDGRRGRVPALSIRVILHSEIGRARTVRSACRHSSSIVRRVARPGAILPDVPTVKARRGLIFRGGDYGRADGEDTGLRGVAGLIKPGPRPRWARTERRREGAKPIPPPIRRTLAASRSPAPAAGRISPSRPGRGGAQGGFFVAPREMARGVCRPRPILSENPNNPAYRQEPIRPPTRLDLAGRRGITPWDVPRIGG